MCLQKVTLNMANYSRGTGITYASWGFCKTPAVFGKDIDTFQPEWWIAALEEQATKPRKTIDLILRHGKHQYHRKPIAMLKRRRALAELGITWFCTWTRCLYFRPDFLTTTSRLTIRRTHGNVTTGTASSFSQRCLFNSWACFVLVLGFGCDKAEFQRSFWPHGLDCGSIDSCITCSLFFLVSSNQLAEFVFFCNIKA